MWGRGGRSIRIEGVVARVMEWLRGGEEEGRRWCDRVRGIDMEGVFRE